MPTNPQPSAKYPGLEKTWQQNLNEIDEQITDFCDSCAGDPSQKITELRGNVQNWFDDQDLDDQTLSELDKSRQDNTFWTSKLNDRLDHLKQNGKVKSGGLQQAAAGQAGQYNKGASGSNKVQPSNTAQNTAGAKNTGSGRTE